MEISQFLKEKLQRLTDRKYLIGVIKNIKTDIIKLKDSKIIRKSSNMITRGKIKIKGTKIFNLKFGSIKPGLIRYYDAKWSPGTNTRKQQ